MYIFLKLVQHDLIACQCHRSIIKNIKGHVLHQGEVDTHISLEMVTFS
jgi:hypothetical protein